MEELEKRDVWPEIVRQRDDLPLAELARRYRTTPGEISAALERTGALGPDLFSDDVDDELPPEPGEASEPAGLLPEVERALENLRAGSKDAAIAEHAALLGQVPDAEVVRRADVSIRTIASFRSRHGIPGYAGPRRKPEGPGYRRSRIDPYVHLLGKVSDHVVAKKAGVTVHAVRSFRAKHDIPMQPISLTELSALEPQGPQAWRVAWLSGAGRRFAVLLASDFEDAMQRALRAGFGAIVGLELLGNVVEG